MQLKEHILQNIQIQLAELQHSQSNLNSRMTLLEASVGKGLSEVNGRLDSQGVMLQHILTAIEGLQNKVL